MKALTLIAMIMIALSISESKAGQRCTTTCQQLGDYTICNTNCWE